MSNRTVTLARVDPLLDALGPEDDVVVDLDALPDGIGVLVIRAGSGDLSGSQFELTDVLTRIGRHPSSEIPLDDITVSRRHAEITRVGSAYFVRDIGSLNGTYVNQERIEDAELRHGDELQVGKFRLVFFDMPIGS